MKLYLDAHISRLVWHYLQSRGHDCLHAGMLPPSTPDDYVLNEAHADGRVVLTADKDFGELVFRRKSPAIGVVLVRLTAAIERERFEAFRTLWPQVEPAAVGHFVVVTDRMIRRVPLSER